MKAAKVKKYDKMMWILKVNGYLSENIWKRKR